MLPLQPSILFFFFFFFNPILTLKRLHSNGIACNCNLFPLNIVYNVNLLWYAYCLWIWSLLFDFSFPCYFISNLPLYFASVQYSPSLFSFLTRHSFPNRKFPLEEFIFATLLWLSFSFISNRTFQHYVDTCIYVWYCKCNFRQFTHWICKMYSEHLCWLYREKRIPCLKNKFIIYIYIYICIHT